MFQHLNIFNIIKIACVLAILQNIYIIFFNKNKTNKWFFHFKIPVIIITSVRLICVFIGYFYYESLYSIYPPFFDYQNKYMEYELFIILNSIVFITFGSKRTFFIIYLIILLSFSKSIIFVIISDLVALLFVIESIFKKKSFWSDLYIIEKNSQNLKNKKNITLPVLYNSKKNQHNVKFSFKEIFSITFFKVFFKNNNNSIINLKLLGFLIFFL